MPRSLVSIRPHGDTKTRDGHVAPGGYLHSRLTSGPRTPDLKGQACPRWIRRPQVGIRYQADTQGTGGHKATKNPSPR